MNTCVFIHIEVSAYGVHGYYAWGKRDMQGIPDKNPSSKGVK